MRKGIKQSTKTMVRTASILTCLCLLGGCGRTAESTNITQGMELLEQLDYQSALESFESAAVYGEDEQLRYRGEGLAYMGMGDYEQAVTSFLASIACADTVTTLEFDTNYYLASAYYKLGQYAEAEKIYTAIIDYSNKEADAYYLRGCTYLKQGYFETAQKDFESAFALAPDNLEMVTDAYVEMQAAGFAEEGKAYIQAFMEQEDKRLTDSKKGTLYYYLGDYANARIYLDSSLNSGNAEDSLTLGKTYEQLGDMNYAAVVYQTYLDSYPPDAAIYNSLGICLMKQEKYEEALENFEAGIEMGDSAYLQNLRFNRIVANEYLGNFSQAKTLMQEYLTVYPDDARAKREAQFLETR